MTRYLAPNESSVGGHLRCRSQASAGSSPSSQSGSSDGFSTEIPASLVDSSSSVPGPAPPPGTAAPSFSFITLSDPTFCRISPQSINSCSRSQASLFEVSEGHGKPRWPRCNLTPTSQRAECSKEEPFHFSGL